MLRQIDDRLWVGSTPTWNMIRSCKADAVLSCVNRGPYEGIQIGLTRYRQILIPDGKIIPRTLFAMALSVVEAWIDEGRTVLVHCNAGRNRSCTVAALFLMHRKAMTGAEALAFVRERRPNAIGNIHFEEWLLNGGLR